MNGQYFGKDCPPGMVQVEFVGCPPELRYSNYGWKPTQCAFIDIYVDGKRFLIEIGDVSGPTITKQRGLHIIADDNISIYHSSINAVTLWMEPPPTPHNP